MLARAQTRADHGARATITTYSLLLLHSTSSAALRRSFSSYSSHKDKQEVQGFDTYDADSRQSYHEIFDGRLIAVKDNIVTKDFPTQAASKILEGYRSPFDATVVQLLKGVGAKICGKTDLDEFGMGSHNQHSTTGTTVSPFRRGSQALSPGGSSGGSAVAVAKDQCWAALGTDTGGSVRLPAAYNGVFGFKPSYGRISRYGVIPYANSLDTVGILAKDARICRKVFNRLRVFDERDPTHVGHCSETRLEIGGEIFTDGERARIGVPKEYIIAELDEPVKTAWAATIETLRAIGHTITPISLPTTQLALSAYYIIAPAEASSNVAKYDGIRYGNRFRFDIQSAEKLPLYARTRGEGFGEEVRRRILLGAYTLSSTAMDNYFIQAQKIRRLVQEDFDRVFSSVNPLQGAGQTVKQGVDVIIVPTAPTLPPTIEQLREQTPIETYMNDVFTVPASLAGLPAISVPVPITGQEPGDVQSAGMQIIGQFGSDYTVLELAEELDSLTPYDYDADQHIL